MTPTRLGAYRLLSPIATRAFTVTYRAEHELLGRPAFVKALKPAVSVSSPFAQELEREARILARLRHEVVPEVLDYCRTTETMWMAIEDPGGHRLDAIIQRAPRLDACTAAAIALELGRGLGHAHERGIVHRGLRPAGIEITAAGRVVVMDFAAAHDARTPSIPEPFEVGSFEHAMDYMAPEQIAGEDGGPPADVFAIGVLLSQLITGAHPFGGASGGGSGDRRELAQRIRSAHAAPLLAAAPDVGRGIERAVARALAKDPADRYPTGRALAAALEEAIAQQTHVPTRVLVSRALAQAKLGEELKAPGTAAVVSPRARARSTGALVAFLAIFALIVAGGVVIELGRGDGGEVSAGGETGSAASAGRGYLRVLARPWAEIVIDGESIDTTPIGRAIPLAAGKHYVTFKHPSAPEEKRTIKLGAGQTVLLDVAMHLDRAPVPDGGLPSKDAQPSSP